MADLIVTTLGILLSLTVSTLILMASLWRHARNQDADQGTVTARGKATRTPADDA